MARKMNTVKNSTRKAFFISKNQLEMSLHFYNSTQRICIYAGVGFENRLPSGNAEKKYDYKIIEMILRTSHAPNQS